MSELCWERKTSRFFSWNECPACGYKSIDTVFGEEIKPDECPGCGMRLLHESKPKPKQFKPSWYKQIDGCMAYFCQFGVRVKERCASCGFNVEEHCRRMNLPWSVNEKGLLCKDISAIKMEDRV